MGKGIDQVLSGGQMNVCVLVMEGTNNEAETMHALSQVGLKPHLVHVGDLLARKSRLTEFQGLVIPGGFSAGDYVRSGAIFASYLRSLLPELQRFIADGYPVLGICNGFQILVELGILPGGEDAIPRVALARNASARFECRTVQVRRENDNLFTRGLKPGEIIELPVAHAEGRFLAPPEVWEKLVERKQVAFRYVGADGARAEYPYNPNGSLDDIAALTNQQGNVFGMMPHPERAFYWYQGASWTRRGKTSGYGPGYAIFRGMADYSAGREGE